MPSPTTYTWHIHFNYQIIYSVAKMDDFLLWTERLIPKDDKCHCTLANLVLFFGYDDPDTWSELVSLVANNNIPALEQHMRENGDIWVSDRHGNTPLHLSVIFKKYDVFNYLMTVEGLRVDALNMYGQTSLFLAVINDSQYFVTELIKKGCDVDLSGTLGCRPLHAAATRYCPKICEILLENGAYLNIVNMIGKTALYHACQYGIVDSIYMMLYYGASAREASIYGVLPLTAAMQRFAFCTVPQEFLECYEVLFNYTFDEGKKTIVDLTNLTRAMQMNSPLFPEILKRVEDVRYSRRELTELSRNAVTINFDYFEMFLINYSHIVEEILKEPTDLHNRLFLGENVDGAVVRLMSFITTIIRVCPSLNFIKNSMNFNYFITTLVSLRKSNKISFEIFEQTIYFLYSHGLPCELAHIGTIYENFGFCEILKFMLDLDITVTYKRPNAVMPYLIYDINLTIEKFVDSVFRPSKKYAEALKFFANQKLRNFLYPVLRKTLEKTPQMPSLLELSRDVARRHIIEAFRIEKTRDFYRVVKKMPINDTYKKILTYEKELYPICLEIKKPPTSQFFSQIQLMVTL